MGTLTTRANVKQFIGILSGVTAFDAVLDTLVTLVDTLVEDYCHRHFADTTYTEFYDGQSNQRRLCLRNYPIISITSIHDDTNRDFDSGTLISADDYTFETGSDSNGIVHFHAASLGRGIRNVKAVYRAGYATIPTPLTMAANMIVAAIYNRRKALGTSGGSLASLSTSLATQFMPDEAKLLLNRYQKWAESA